VKEMLFIVDAVFYLLTTHAVTPRDLFSGIACVLFLGAFLPYIIATLRKKTKPMKATWIIWWVLDIITLAGEYAKHSINGQIIGAVAGAGIVVVLALKYGTPGWTRLEKLCLAGAFVGVAIWGLTNDPVWGILICSGVIFGGSIPTFISAWTDPKRENKLAWSIYFTSCFPAMLAVPRWTLADAAQPINFLIIESIMMYILYIRPRLRVK